MEETAVNLMNYGICYFTFFMVVGAVAYGFVEAIRKSETIDSVYDSIKRFRGKSHG